MKPGGEEYKVVAVLSNEIEAISLVEYLKEAGIPAYIKRYSIPAFDPLFFGEGAPGIGVALEGKWGELLVPESRAEEARQIIDEIKKNLGL